MFADRANEDENYNIKGGKGAKLDKDNKLNHVSLLSYPSTQSAKDEHRS